MLKEYFPRTRHNVIVIGIAPWGVVNEKDSLIGCGVSQNEFFSYFCFFICKKKIKNKIKKILKK